MGGTRPMYGELFEQATINYHGYLIATSFFGIDNLVVAV